MQFTLKARATGGKARTGTLTTRRGPIDTPVFMPVGTRGTVKALSPEDLRDAGAGIILGNTYHLYLRPGCGVIERFSGLHRFMNWDGAILTDSGGFQVFSLAKLSKISEEGVTFQSHLDGSPHRLTPENAVEIQACLDSDIMMCLDECISYPAEEARAEDACRRTARWAERCRAAYESLGPGRGALFGIQQGGMFPRLREQSTRSLLEIGFDGYAVGGLSVGEPKELMMETARVALPLLPEERPRYVMGVGKPEDIVEMVGMGADMFDCVLPTRDARNGRLYTAEGVKNIVNARYKTDDRPLDDTCACYTCRHYSRAYLRHLYQSRELLVYRLTTLHNITYYMNLMAQIRKAIREDAFAEFSVDFYQKRIMV